MLVYNSTQQVSVKFNSNLIFQPRLFVKFTENHYIIFLFLRFHLRNRNFRFFISWLFFFNETYFIIFTTIILHSINNLAFNKGSCKNFAILHSMYIFEFCYQTNLAFNKGSCKNLAFMHSIYIFEFCYQTNGVEEQT